MAITTFCGVIPGKSRWCPICQVVQYLVAQSWLSVGSMVWVPRCIYLPHTKERTYIQWRVCGDAVRLGGCRESIHTVTWYGECVEALGYWGSWRVTERPGTEHDSLVGGWYLWICGVVNLGSPLEVIAVSLIWATYGGVSISVLWTVSVLQILDRIVAGNLSLLFTIY